MSRDDPSPDHRGQRYGPVAMNYDEEYKKRVRAIQREEIALFCLGPKGQYFDGDEWERRADDWALTRENDPRRRPPH